MRTQNTWNKGLNSDISGLKTDGTTYLSAENFRIVSSAGQSTYALENTKGQTIAFKLPSVINAIYKLDPQDFTGNIVVVIGSSAPTTINNFDLLTPKTIQESLLLEPTIASQVASGDIAIQYNNSYVVIVGLDSATSLSVNGVAQTAFVDQISSPKINGAINIKDKIVLFSTPNQQNPVSFPNLTSTGQIWVVRYDENTNLVSGLVNDTLVPSEHLKYHQNLNFTLWRKISGEGRWEYTDGQKVYFTDFFNSARLFNIASANSFATPIEVINMKPLHSTSTPVIQSVNDGGFIKTGSIQYFYQLYSNLGTETTFSEASNLVPLAVSSTNSGYESYQGGSQGVVSGKSVSLKITDIDTNYENIKVGYILWEAENLATVRLFYEAAVPPNGEILLTHSGSEDEIAITLEQYRALQAAFDKCKGFAQKKNILLAFNTTTDSFNVNIDCRTYRFNSSRYAHLYDKEDSYGNPRFIIRGSDKAISVYGAPFSGSWEDIPQEADLINPYNNEESTITPPPQGNFNNNDWFTNSQFKYQSDGLTLGGEGPIVSYVFIDKGDELVNPAGNNYTDYGDEFQGIAGGAPMYGYPLIGAAMPSITGFNYTPGTGYTFPVNSGFAASKNPLLKSLFTGYASGEVYRFGSVFFNNRFQNSFVPWIGDIKFPFPQDGHDLFDWSNPGGSSGLGGYITMRQMGIVFSMNTSQISQATLDEITGWSYVRLDRTSLDKTRLGVGILNPVNASGTTYYGGNPKNSFNQGIEYTNASNNLATIENPNFKFNIGNGYTGADYIRHVYGLTYTLAGDWLPNSDIGLTKFYDRSSTNTLDDIVPLSGMLDVPVSTSQNIIAGSPILPNPFINMALNSGGGANWDAWGGYTHLISTVTIPPSAPNIWGLAGVPASESFARMISYERWLDGQYNGNNWEVRLGQEYIGTTHYQPWDNTLSGIITSEVFGGDVLRTIFDWMKYDLNDTINNVSSGYSNSGSGNTRGLIQIFPCEVSFDLNLRQGFHAANKQGASGEPNHDEFIYNTAYSQQNTSQAFFSIPYNFREINENPYRIWASQQKFDGEVIDAWAQWRSADFGDAEGTFGPINNITLNTDRVFFYQDYAIAVEAVKEQQLIGEGTSTALVLGEGSVLQRYDYITKNTGCKHQWGVINTPKGTYHVDVSLRKIFLLSEAGDKFGLTDLKGLNVEFQKLIQQRIKDTDLPLINGGVTIHGGWNPKHNEVFFTLLDNNTTNIGHIVGTGTTITYNELTETFDSFHKYSPSLYHRNQNHFLSINPGTDSNTMWEHDTGSYNVYYGVAQPSTLKFTINLDPATTSKRLDILEFATQINETLANGGIGQDIPTETITSIRVTNSYQDTLLIPLIPQGNFIRRWRVWRFNQLRDSVVNRPRLKDFTFTVEVTFDNPLNRRLVMNDVISTLELQPF